MSAPGLAPGSPDGPILVIDSATTRVVVALAGRDGSIRAGASWEAGYRHGETLLPSIERLLADEGVDRYTLAGLIVGTGPGAFTGLRVGIATAKGLAHGLRRPLVGVSTAEALLRAAASDHRAAGPGPGTGAVLLLPAGPSDRIVVRTGSTPQLLRGGDDPELAPGEWLVAVDLPDRAPSDALARGEAARGRLAESLATMGSPGLAAADVAAMAELVPDYVTLPRGIVAPAGEVEWSRDPR